jgi:hypothetical protein
VTASPTLDDLPAKLIQNPGPADCMAGVLFYQFFQLDIGTPADIL